MGELRIRASHESIPDSSNQYWPMHWASRRRLSPVVLFWSRGMMHSADYPAPSKDGRAVSSNRQTLGTPQLYVIRRRPLDRLALPVIGSRSWQDTWRGAHLWLLHLHSQSVYCPLAGLMASLSVRRPAGSHVGTAYYPTYLGPCGIITSDPAGAVGPLGAEHLVLIGGPA
jgi:hypothetical protein